MKYAILWNKDMRVLEVEVQEHIDSGWKPCGGFAIEFRVSDLPRYYQAMTKED